MHVQMMSSCVPILLDFALINIMYVMDYQIVLIVVMKKIVVSFFLNKYSVIIKNTFSMYIGVVFKNKYLNFLWYFSSFIFLIPKKITTEFEINCLVVS